MGLLEQLPPFDEVAERCALGSALLEIEAAELVLELLKPDYFYLPKHRTIFMAIRKVAMEGATVEEATVVLKLTAARKLDEVGGQQEIGRLMTETPSAANVETYCQVVKEHYLRRKLIEHSIDMLRKAHDVSANVSDSLGASVARAEQLLAGSLGAEAEPQDMQDIANHIIDEALAQPSRDFWGLRTGIAGDALDNMTGGVCPGQLWVIAARAGVGKSTLLDNVALNIHDLQPEAGEPLIITTEMTTYSLALKAIAARTGVHPTTIRKRKMGDEGRVKMAELKKGAYLRGIKLLYLPSPSLEQVYAIARRHKRACGLSALIVDLASYVRVSGRFDKENDRLTAVAKGLRDMGGKLQCGIFAAVQLNRGVELNANRRPTTANLKGSGGWEETADFVIFLHRPGHGSENKDKRTHIIIDKNREDGPCGTIHVVYLPGEGRYAQADEKGATYG